MSEDNISGSAVENTDTEVRDSEYVSKKAYEQKTRDMHKFKDSLREAQAKLAEYEAELAARDEARMRENNQYKELSEKYKQEAEELRNARLRDRQAYIDTVKRSALKEELGASINDAYLIHANIDAIEVNEHGVVDRESLLNVANNFRKEHAILIRPSSGSNSTSFASPINSTASAPQKSLEEMSTEELSELYKQSKQA